MAVFLRALCCSPRGHFINSLSVRLQLRQRQITAMAAPGRNDDDDDLVAHERALRLMGEDLFLLRNARGRIAARSIAMICIGNNGEPLPASLRLAIGPKESRRRCCCCCCSRRHSPDKRQDWISGGGGGGSAAQSIRALTYWAPFVHTLPLFRH